MTEHIVIYQDEGVGEFGLGCLKKFFADHDVRVTDAQGVIDGSAFAGRDLFVMPGGADLPYCKKLNGRGNAHIRDFVENGGTYLGICAGAYYACKAIEFHKGRADEISGPRELAFTDAVAFGSLPAIAPHYDLTLKSAGIADITLKDGTKARAFYHGGPAFRCGNDNTEILATYAHSKEPAILRHRVGKGRAILSGVHLEVDDIGVKNHPVESEQEEHQRNFLYQKLAIYPAAAHQILKELIQS